MKEKKLKYRNQKHDLKNFSKSLENDIASYKKKYKRLDQKRINSGITEI